MEKITKVGRSFYSIALVAYGIQQFVYADFRTVFLPAWQLQLPALAIWAYFFGLFLIAAGLAIFFEKRAKEISLLVGIVLLAFFCLVHIPYEIISDPYSKHFGSWVNALKELALSGGAFVVAGTFTADTSAERKYPLIHLSEKMIPFGKVFFSITMISFGIQHFMYAGNVATLVPAWFPDHLFWTYFAAVTLIGSGVAIILDIRRKQIAILLGTMIFLWFLILHIPRAIDSPFLNRGNEVSSAFDALAFSGIAFIIAFTGYAKKDELG